MAFQLIPPYFVFSANYFRNETIWRYPGSMRLGCQTYRNPYVPLHSHSHLQESGACFASDQIIGEIHRRSLWQVLSIYLVGSWVALQVVETITESAGLPDWVQPFSLILLIIGFPIVMATAVVQEGVSGKSSGRSEREPGAIGPSPAPEAGQSAGFSPSVSAPGPGAAVDATGTPDFSGTTGGARRLFTWRNAVAGGVAAFAFLGAVVVGYFVMWSTGIGPVGSLAAQGVFEEGDAVVLAQFEDNSNDRSLGGMVTEALRVDLAGSSILTLVEANRVREARERPAALDGSVP